MIQLPSLPSEIWAIILRHAVATDLLDLDFLLRVGAIWYLNSWRPSLLAQINILETSFGTKKTIIRVCKAWRDIGTPLLWEIICITETNVDLLTSRLIHSQQLATLAGNPSLCFGWWTKHLYIEDAAQSLCLDKSLARAISCFPNLTILTLPTNCGYLLPPGAQYSPCIEAVCQSCPALEFVDWEPEEYDSEMFRRDWCYLHTNARNLRAIRFAECDPKSTCLSPTITTVVYGLGMTKEAARSLQSCRHFIVDLDCPPAEWSPMLHSLRKTVTTVTLVVDISHLQEPLSAVAESGINLKKLAITFTAWRAFHCNSRFPPTMTILSICSDTRQERHEGYRYLIAGLRTMTAEGLQTVQLVNSQNCNHMRQHSAIMRLARAQLVEKEWNLLDDKGRPLLKAEKSVMAFKIVSPQT